MGKEVQWNEKCFATGLLKMAYFGPSGAKSCVFCLAILALRFQCFQRNSVDIQKPVLQNPGAPPKNTKMRMGAAQQINCLTIFWRPSFGASCCHFKIGNMKIPFSPQFWPFLHTTTKSQLHTHLHPKGGAKDERPKMCFRVPHFQHGAARRRRICRAPLAITEPTIKKRGFLASDAARPIFDACPGGWLNN